MPRHSEMPRVEMGAKIGNMIENFCDDDGGFGTYCFDVSLASCEQGHTPSHCQTYQIRSHSHELSKLFLAIVNLVVFESLISVWKMK